MNLGAQQHQQQQRLFCNDKHSSSSSSSRKEITADLCANDSGPGAGSSCSLLHLSCMMGFTGSYQQTLLCHPLDSDLYISAIGPVVLISSLSQRDGQQRFLRHHQQDIVSITISRSGRYLVSGQVNSSSSDPDTSIGLWDLHTDSLLSTFGCGRGQVKLLEFTSDEKWISCCTDQNLLYVWEVQSGDMVLAAPRQQYSCMKFGPPIPSKSRRNPTYLLYACVQNSVQVSTFHYDIKTMQYEMSSRRCDVPGRCALIRSFTCCVLSADDQHLLCGTTAGDVCIFHVGLGQYRSRFQVCSGGVQSMVVCNLVLLIGGGDGSLYKYEHRDQNWILQSETKLFGSITNLSSSPDMKEVISGTNMSCIYRSRVSDLQSLLIQRSSRGAVSQLTFPADSQFRIAATISMCGSVMIWDLADYSIISFYQGPCPGTSIIFDRANEGGESDLLTGWDDGSIRLYSSTEERIRWQICDAARGAIISLQQYQDIIIVAGSKSGAIRIWSKSNRTMISEYVAHSCSPIIDVILDKTRPHLIHSLGSDRRLVSYDYQKKLYLSGHQLDDSVYQSISQRNTGEAEIAAGLGDGRIMIYDLDLSDPVYCHETDTKRSIVDLNFSPDGRYLVIAQASDQIVLYDFTDQQRLRYRARMLLHSSKITSICFTPDQQQIFCACQDSSIVIINFTPPS